MYVSPQCCLTDMDGQRPQCGQISHKQRVFVADDHLRQILLVERIVANQSHMSQVGAATCTAHLLHGRVSLPLLSHDDCASLDALQQTHGRLVQVDDQGLLPGGHLARQMVAPLPTREGLADRPFSTIWRSQTGDLNPPQNHPRSDPRK